MSRSDNVLSSVNEVIGDTPLVELQRMTGNLPGRILAKLDYLNPGFSKKDRIALQMIEDAEEQGLLKPGQEVVELTSGNTGTGLAIVCTVKGYKFVAVMSKGNSQERARMMAALGAKVVLVDQAPGSPKGQVSGEDLALVEQETQRIVEERKAFRADQFILQGNFRAHYLHTGPEILRQTNGRLDVFCDFVGSGGTFAGVSAALKEHHPLIKCFIVEPTSAAILAGKRITNPNHRIQGGGYSMKELPLMRSENIDGFLQVSDKEAIETARNLAKSEGIFAGFSSGANVAAALRLLNGEFKGKTIVTLINDSGLKYLSTDLWGVGDPGL
ncbi:MAG: cysteine synthase family protein [Candidatus Aminicenantes bacterium]|jgi:cysteine synthase A